MKQGRQKLLSPNSNLKIDANYVQCNHCLNKICFDCIIGLHTYIIGNIYKCVYVNDPSFVALDSMRKISMEINQIHPSVPMGPCCAFKSTIPSHIKPTITRPPRPPTCDSVAVKTGNGSDGDYVFVNKTQAQESWRRRKNRIRVNVSSLEFLNAYFDASLESPLQQTVIIPPHTILHKINLARKRNRKSSRRNKQRLNPFEGGLLLPMYDLVIEANASENQWMIDHMCLGESEDGTPAVIHGVPSTQSSRQAFELIIKNNITLQRANECTELIDLVDVSYPECDSKKRTY